MRTLFNDNWEFFELPLNETEMYENDKPILFSPDQFIKSSLDYTYKKVQIPHDWMIVHTKELYKNSVGFYKKTFNLTKEQLENHIALRFESVYMNCGIYINGKKCCEWKYGYSTFEADLTNLVKEGENLVQVIAVYQNCNTRWYSGAGIIRDVHLISVPKTYLVTDGVYIVNRPCENTEDNRWTCTISAEVITDTNSTEYTVKNTFIGCDNKSPKTTTISTQIKDDGKFTQTLKIENPEIWDINHPYFYICKTELFDANGKLLDEISQHCGFKTAHFDKDNGFFLNGRHLKIQGACHHHDQGALGAAFNVNALRRQFNKLKDMGVNSVRCSHNPPPQAWMDLADEMGLLIDDECFDMWESPKTPFDYGNYFNNWFQKDVLNWVRKDRNHPCLIMWSIGNEIYDTHKGNGLEITKKLYKIVRDSDPDCNAPITIASNYMMTDGAQECAKEIDIVGYNYLERLYDEHHIKYPNWKMYGSETGSTVQSRGIYHFPETLKLLTFSDGQCSTLGNCTVPWGAANTQSLISFERDCPFSAGQYIWTGWDYIGEPTPYHSKNSFFGQIDTAGFEKDTYYLYKSEWLGKNTKPFVHLLPYWDWNEGQKIDVKAYTNADFIELFVNGNSLGKQEINHNISKEPFGRWQVEYHKGEIKAVAYDNKGKIIAEDTKCSFEDPSQIILKPETQQTGNLYFVDIMLADRNEVLVENARNYITFNVTGKAKLVGMDNGDSTDYDEYTPNGENSLTRRLFSNRLVAIIRAQGSFVITAASKDLPTVSLKFDGKNWIEVAPYYAIKPEKEFIPVRKIEIQCDKKTHLNKNNKEILVTAKVFPENATNKKINWNPVLKECVSCDFISVENIKNDNEIQIATIKAQCDGECILRCTSKNESNLDEVISDLEFSVSEIGNPKLNPYKLIEACRFSNWNQKHPKPTVCLESGISTRGTGDNWITFDKVDFGIEGADTIHIPIFSFETELPLEVWKGTPENGRKLGDFIYKHKSIYNTYSENVFTLNERLFGIQSISFVFPHEVYFHGFYFDTSKKALSKLRALDATLISGDSFTKSNDIVQNIGNNVSLDFHDMNFEDTTITSITICGKSHTQNNTINLKFFDNNGKCQTQVIEFSNNNSKDDFEEKTFELSPITGKNSVSFVFLPGSNFDFKWFKFE